MNRIGEVEALYRYPVKSMAGERLDVAEAGWHGLAGDRRLALRRMEDRGGFPWLTASKLPELILFEPLRREPSGSGDLPSHVRSPDGNEWPLFSPELAQDISRRHGAPVEMMHLNRGIFDEASVSLIAAATVAEVGRLAAQPPDVRRFRANIVITTLQAVPFAEATWVGGTLRFGDAPDGAAISITNHDERCAMVNLDPDSARADPEVLKAIVRAAGNNSGVYGMVLRRGPITVGQPIFYEPAAGHGARP